MHRTIKTIPVLLAASLLASPAPAGADANIWEDKEQFVRLESQGDRSARENDHPVELSSGEIVAALQSLQADFPKEESSLKVFTSVEVEVLGNALSRGLAQAESRQDVTFATIGTHSVGGLVRRRRVNTGRVFYSTGKLNIILGEVLGEYRKKNVYGQRDEDFRPRAYGQRAAAAEHKWRIVPSAGLAYHRQGGTERDDWLVIDTALASASMAQPPSREAVSQAERSPALAPPPEPPAPPQPAEPVPPPPTVAPAELPTSEARADASSEHGAHSSAAVEDRLKRLKELRDKDLISDEAYEQKMREILSEL